MQFEMTKCEFCGHHQPIQRTGVMRVQKGKVANKFYTFSYDHIDPEVSQFISIREPRGRGKGMPEIGRITLREAVENNQYQDLREGLLNQCVKVLKILTKEE
ncbi:MAG: hypothetical protein GH144_01195 [Clostridia bacterium]|nr:hypothetical protein [Clostridia bacterium]